MENPYQSPNVEPTESSVTNHRSFRLTRCSTSPDASITVGSFRDALVFSLVQQLPLLVLSALLLDGGLVFQRVAIASIAYWVMTLLIMIRRGRNMSRSDILLLKWGFLPLLLTTCTLWLLASTMLP